MRGVSFSQGINARRQTMDERARSCETDPALTLGIGLPMPMPNRIIVYDHTCGWLSTSYRLGARLLQMRGKAETVLSVGSWASMVAMLQGRRGITALQVFGHGQPGSPVIAGHPLDTDSLRRLCADLRPCFDPAAYVWWRCCSAFAGDVGQRFAAECALGLGVRVYGHYDVIGPLQPGLTCRGIGQLEIPWTSAPGPWWKPDPRGRTVTCLAAEPT